MRSRSPTLSRKKALGKILRAAKAVGVEEIPLSRAGGRVLRKALKTDRPLPPFHRSVMDGYAVRAADLASGPRELSVVAEIPAGTVWDGTVRPGCCVAIMTGAPVPRGADAVVPVEDATGLGSGRVRLHPENIRKGAFVHPRGSDGRTGKTACAPGFVLGPEETAAAASIGATRLKVTRRVRAAILTTGREIVPPGRSPEPWEIRDANGPALRTFLNSLPWVKGRFLGIAPDRPEALRRRIRRGLAETDLLVVTGGVSVGRYDFVPAVLTSLGVRRIFHRIRMRPGKPLWFGRRPRGPLVFGVPGNPVSAFVAAQEFLLPALGRLAGLADPGPRALFLPLAADWEKSHPFEEARITRLASLSGRTVLRPVPYRGSGDFLAAVGSDGLALFPADRKHFGAGEIVEFHPWPAV
jgi:molybdopterin molybdotransferase